jgi:dTDP-4-dehydrorhamnose 3,5-epimerase-like enzyme
LFEMDLKITEIDAKENERGIFAEILKSNQTEEQIKETLLVISKPGAVRGNHYHKKKVEWLCLIKGRGQFIYIDIKTGEKKEFVIDNKLTLIKTPLNVAHAVKNIGKDELILLEISNQLFEEDPDIFEKEIL